MRPSPPPHAHTAREARILRAPLAAQTLLPATITMSPWTNSVGRASPNTRTCRRCTRCCPRLRPCCWRPRCQRRSRSAYSSRRTCTARPTAPASDAASRSSRRPTRLAAIVASRLAMASGRARTRCPRGALRSSIAAPRRTARRSMSRPSRRRRRWRPQPSRWRRKPAPPPSALRHW